MRSLALVIILCAGFAAVEGADIKDTKPGIALTPIQIASVPAQTITPRRITRRVTIEWSDDAAADPTIAVNRVTAFYDDKGAAVAAPAGAAKVDQTYEVTVTELSAIAPEFVAALPGLITGTDKLDQSKLDDVAAKAAEIAVAPAQGALPPIIAPVSPVK